jgi:hypothetical protein|tara:strand:+ start:1079 stop:1252 length:174 start_codon:yes stop_codon:yes gene_type:complete
MNIKTAKYVENMEKNVTVKVTEEDGTIRWIPINTKNMDYVELQEWAAVDGNNIEAAD